MHSRFYRMRTLPEIDQERLKAGQTYFGRANALFASIIIAWRILHPRTQLSYDRFGWMLFGALFLGFLGISALTTKKIIDSFVWALVWLVGTVVVGGIALSITQIF
jgi:hypothetical protein